MIGAWAPKRGVRRRLLVVLAMLAVLAVLVVRATAAQSDVGITGHVVDAASGRPVSAAIVTVTTGGPAILTGADGRFVLPGLPPGSYTVLATKGGYAEGASGRRRPGGSAQPVVLTEATKTADVVIRLWKYGAITGTVTDEAGEPVVGLFVRLVPRKQPGVPLNTPAGAGTGFVVTGRPVAPIQVLTDDRGVYRFGNVVDGDYLVVASSPLVSGSRNIIGDTVRTGNGTGAALELLSATATAGGRAVAESAAPMEVGGALVSVGRGRAVVLPSAGGHVRVYPPTFHPAALVASQAATVTVSAGQERAGVDIALAPVPAARVAGVLLDRDGPVASTAIRLVPAGSESVPLDAVAPMGISDASGTFLFAGVPPGSYRMRAISWRTQSAVDLPLTVAGDDIEGLPVTASPLPKITATLQFDGNTPAPSVQDRGSQPALAVLLDSADTTAGPLLLDAAIVATERTYTVIGYPPGRYRIRVASSPTGWMFKAAMLNGVDVSETPFDLTKDTDLTLVFTDRWTGIGGLVQGAGADAATVLAFPADASKWSGEGIAPRRFKTGRADARGRFGISSLPPGDYYVIAIPEEQTDDWRSPSTLDALARAATTVTVLEGEYRAVNVPVRQVRQ